jgi:type VI protein secretion system component Hcp
MPDLTLTRDDMKHLGSTLDQMAQTFDERERVLLLTIIELANEALAARATDSEVTAFATGTPSLSEIVVTKPTDVSSPGLALSQLGSDLPSESLSLNFTKIEFQYR